MIKRWHGGWWLAPALLLLAASAMALARQGWLVTWFPYQIDYGEGIVWQQMRSIVAGHGYAPLDGFPDIVFHYPPIYHLTSWIVSVLSGIDGLAAGRLVSLAATFIALALAGAIAAAMLPRGYGRRWRLTAALAAALMGASTYPLQQWIGLMRVDMLALAFALLGLRLTLRSLSRPGWIIAAGIALTAAVFTKQIALAAPAAAFLVLLLVRPSLAVRLLATCLILGIAAATGLTVMTDGGFLRHLVEYNINRFEPRQLTAIPMEVITHPVIIVLALAAMFTTLRRTFADPAGTAVQAIRSDQNLAARLMVVVYFLITTLMTLLIAKSGAGLNYLIEWLVAASILAAFQLAEFGRRASDPAQGPVLFAGMSLALAIQAAALLANPSGYTPQGLGRYAAQLAPLQAELRSTRGPVISDEMVLLIRSGHEVLWESAIFAELGSKGRYDLAPFIRKIENRDFPMIITIGKRGDWWFDARYPAPVADAIDRAYPRTRNVGELVVRHPAPRP